jgi:beta-amylase
LSLLQLTICFSLLQVPGIHWWYRTESHAAEATAGFFTADSRCGYKSIARMFAAHNTTFNFTCAEMRTADQPKEALCDPEALVLQVLFMSFENASQL